MRVTEKFGISGSVPFLDVHVERDNKLYLDPSAIRNGRDAYSRRANALLVDFFREVVRLRESSLASDHAIGEELLSNLHEPNENRLGMSLVGVGGRAIGPEIAAGLWASLQSNPAVRAAALTRIEHLRVCVDAVGPDLVSDLTTRIIYEVLADYTASMMALYPALSADATTATTKVFKSRTNSWTDQTFTLPFVDPHQLLLIPKEWVYWRLLMEPEPFYNRFATATVQEERSTLDPKGRRRGPSKKTLREEFNDHRSLNSDQVVKYKSQGRDLIGEYQSEVDRNFEPLTDDEIEQRTSP